MPSYEAQQLHYLGYISSLFVVGFIQAENVRSYHHTHRKQNRSLMPMHTHTHRHKFPRRIYSRALLRNGTWGSTGLACFGSTRSLNQLVFSATHSFMQFTGNNVTAFACDRQLEAHKNTHSHTGGKRAQNTLTRTHTLGAMCGRRLLVLLLSAGDDVDVVFFLFCFAGISCDNFFLAQQQLRRTNATQTRDKNFGVRI